MVTEWSSCSLGNLFKVKHGFAFKGEFFTDAPTNALLVTPGNFAIGGGFQNPKPKYYNGPIPEDYILAPGQVVVTMTDLSKQSDTLGLAATIPADEFTWLHNQRVGLLEFKSKIPTDPQFISYLLRTHTYRSWVIGSASGTTVKHTSPGRIESFECKVPPIEEQRAIAHILGTLDDKIELNRQMNATLEAMAQALFKSWFVDFDPVIDNALASGNPIPEPLQVRAEKRAALSDQRKPLPADIQQLFPNRFTFTDEMGWVPEGWKPTQFGSVSKCFDSKRIPLSKKQREEKKPGLIPYYGATSVMDYINEWIFDDVYLLIGEDGSVIKEDGTPFVQYIWGKAWVNNHAHVLQGDKGISTEHLMLFISVQNMAAYVTGAVQLKINQKNMNSIPFLKANGSINQHFAAVIAPYFDKLRKNNDETETLTKARDSLLPKLLSGQLRIPEAEQQVTEAL
ncbi:MAG: restriction endonuclease subunit S [Gammaproteobacteria bacterium]|nr:MAG: restriction endonuclease subunit S [Gammaproteobacteria bacterium]